MPMATSRAAGRPLIAVMVVVVLLLADAAGEPAGATEDVQSRRHRPRTRIRPRNAPPRTPTTPPVQPVRPVHPAPAPPAPAPATPVPHRCNDTFAPEEFPTASGDVCTPVPAPAPTPTPVPPPHRAPAPQCPPCRCSCPKTKPEPQPPRHFPGWPVPVPGRDAGAGYDCVTPLSALTPCLDFVTGNETETPSHECCNGIGLFLRTARASAAAGRGEHVLQCLCPVILGDVNKILPNPIDPLRLMYVPIACGEPLPPQLLYQCFGGRPFPVVTNFPASWGNDPASASP